MNAPKQDLQDFARGVLDSKATALQAKALMPDHHNQVEVASMSSPVNLPASIPPLGRRSGGGRNTPASLGRLVLAPGTTAAKIKVTPGTVNSVMPTLGGTALNAGTAPEITIAADTWVWLKCVGTFAGPSYTVTVETSLSSSPPAGTTISTTGFTSYRLIGSVTYAAGVATIADNRQGGDLGVESFGGANFWWLT